MVDFNWCPAAASSNDWPLRAERLRAEIDANRYWYSVITRAIPRYASSEDSERVALLLNRRMAQTREMERELTWLEQSLRPGASPTGRATAAPTAHRRASEQVAIDAPRAAACDQDATTRLSLSVHGTSASVLALVFRQGLEQSTFGQFLLVIAVMILAWGAANILAGVLRMVGEMIEGRRELQYARRLNEDEIVRWHRSLRLRTFRASLLGR